MGTLGRPKSFSVRAALRAVLGLVGTGLALLVSVPVLVCGIPFWIAAGVTRALARKFEPSVVPWQAIVSYDPSLGWKPRPNLDAHCSTEEIFRVTTGADGWRGSTGLAGADIAVFGDSFAFGYGVDEPAMYSAQVPGLAVKPIGAPGYNMVQELLAMRQYASQLAGKLVVWFVFPGNDLADNLAPHMQIYRTPFVRRPNGAEQWQIETGHLSEKTRSYQFGKAHEAKIREMIGDLCCSSYLSERAYSAARFLIEEGRQVCFEAGAELCVLVVPDRSQLNAESVAALRDASSDPGSFDPALPEKSLARICSDLGASFIAGRDWLSAADYRQIDRHWNEQGHRRIGAALAAVYQTHSASLRSRTPEPSGRYS